MCPTRVSWHRNVFFLWLCSHTSHQWPTQVIKDNNDKQVYNILLIDRRRSNIELQEFASKIKVDLTTNPGLFLPQVGYQLAMVNHFSWRHKNSTLKNYTFLKPFWKQIIITKTPASLYIYYHKDFQTCLKTRIILT